MMLLPRMNPGHAVHNFPERGPFRQILAATADAIDGSNTISFATNHLPCLLMERRNGQVICLRILNMPHRTLSLGSFAEALDRLMPRDVGGRCNTQSIESEMARTSGHVIVFREVELASGSLLCIKNDKDLYPIEFEDGLARFIGRLDQRVLEMLAMSHRPLTPGHYNRYFSTGPTVRHRRIQAAQAFPLLEQDLMSQERSGAAIRRAVDSAKELLPVLRKSLNISNELARWLGGKSLDQVGLTWQGRIRELSIRMACLPPPQRPASQEEWQAFNEFIEVIDAIYADNAYQVDSPNTLLLREVARLGWLEAKRKLESLGLTPASLVDMNDIIDELIEVLIEDIGEGSIMSEVLESDPSFALGIRRRFHSIGLMRQIRTSLRWHQLQDVDLPQMQNEPVSANLSNFSWTAAFQGHVDLGDTIAYCISNVVELREEGRLMQHCVGGYTDRCLYHGSTIVSLRQPNGERLSTAELVLYIDPNNLPLYRLRQHKAKKNAPPSISMIRALELVLTQLNGGANLERRTRLLRELKLRNQHRTKHRFRGLEKARIRRLQQALELHIGYEEFRFSAVS